MPEFNLVLINAVANMQFGFPLYTLANYIWLHFTDSVMS